MDNRIENKFVVLINGIVTISVTSLIIAIWPVYGWWAILFVPIMSMGVLMLNHFVPFEGIANTLILYTYLILLIVYGLFK